MAIKKDYRASPEEIDYIKFADSTPEFSEEVPWYRGYANAAIRGGIKGVKAVNRMFAGAPTEKKDIEASEDLDDFLDKYFPTGDSLGQRSLEGATESVAETAAFPGASQLKTLTRAAIGGGGAEVLKDMGFSEPVQTAFEVGTQLTPDLSKKIPQKLAGKSATQEKELAKYARSMGMEEKELALALEQNEKYADYLSKYAYKGGKVKNALERTKDSLSRVYNSLRNRPDAQKALTGQQQGILINEMSNRLSKMPSEIRDRIMKDYNDFLGTQMKGTDIFDFWHKMNTYIGKGENTLGLLKDPLTRALTDISPKLGADFQMTNKLYQNYVKNAERLAPSLADKMILAGESAALLYSTVSGNYPLMTKVLGEVSARNFARELIINPRLRNMTTRFAKSLQRGSPRVAKKIYDEMILEIGKTNAEAAMKLSEFDLDQFFDSLPENKS